MKEKDSIGEIEIPDSVYYGSYTARALELNISPYRATQIIPEFIHSIFFVKKCAAIANKKIGSLSPEIADSIIQAANEALSGKFNSFILIDMYQGNGDVATVMNINEILAKRANEILTGKIGTSHIKPNDHVSCNQATTDSLMIASHITCYEYLLELQSILQNIAQTFLKKGKEYENVVKAGRTELRDALPVTVGQNFISYYEVLSRYAKETQRIMNNLLVIPLGATAMGTGIGAVPEYAPAALEVFFNSEKKYTFSLPKNKLDAIQNCDAMLDVALFQEKVASTISKITKDIRLLGSGPSAGFNELFYPPVIPGSVTLPGKTNPTIEELILRVNMRVMANSSIALKCIENAELEYNYLETFMNISIMESFVLMNKAYNLILEKCYAKLDVNIDICKKYAHSSKALSILLTPVFGYQIATKIGVRCYKEKKNIDEIIVDEGLMTKEDADYFFNPLHYTNQEVFYKILEEAKKKYKK